MTHLDVSNQFQFWRWLNQINARSTQPDRPGQTRLVYSPSWFAAQQALIDFGTAATWLHVWMILVTSILIILVPTTR